MLVPALLYKYSEYVKKKQQQQQQQQQHEVRYLLSDMTLCHWVFGSQCFKTTTLSQTVGNQILGDAGPYPRRMDTAKM